MLVIFDAHTVLIAPAVTLSINAARVHETEYCATFPHATSWPAGVLSLGQQVGTHPRTLSYVFRDPGSKSELPTGTTNQITKIEKSVGAPSPLSVEPDLLSALARLGEGVCRRQRSGGIAV